MKCPYCASMIADEALVCATCRRELYLVKQLLKRIEELEALAVQAAARETPVAPAAPTAVPPAVIAELPGKSELLAQPGHSWRAALYCWLVPTLGLVGAHWLLIFVYDVKLIVLRLLGLLLPLPGGFAFARATGGGLVGGLVAAAAMAVAAVLGMSAITAAIDQVPILPGSVLELREFVEFAASIGGSFFTGAWLQRWLQRRLQLNRNAALDGKAMTESLKHLNDTGSAVVAAATTAFSIYTGLRGFLGL